MPSLPSLTLNSIEVVPSTTGTMRSATTMVEQIPLATSTSTLEETSTVEIPPAEETLIPVVLAVQETLTNVVSPSIETSMEGESSTTNEHRCRYCDKIFSNISNARRHEKRECAKNPPRNMFGCENCRNQFSRKDHMKTHMKTCKSPAVRQKVKASIQQRCLDVHKSMPGNSTTVATPVSGSGLKGSSSLPWYPYSYYNTSFVFSHDARRHERSKCKKNPSRMKFRCDECLKWFTRIDSLRHHAKKCKGEVCAPTAELPIESSTPRFRLVTRERTCKKSVVQKSIAMTSKHVNKPKTVFGALQVNDNGFYLAQSAFRGTLKD
ncbi:zinc finger and BTB domain-containing protein 14-like [Bacillus rossius redtenbacheri]|uniref:zinc finger and BTB domain-containing protein 14-like n=1 Tax=Bacillus rossius redtenbacheri TaxID=93214 RepID=UPI002FDD0F09